MLTNTANVGGHRKGETSNLYFATVVDYDFQKVRQASMCSLWMEPGPVSNQVLTLS